MSTNKIKKEIEKEKQNILAQFLKSAPFDGWNESNLKKSTIDCGYKDGYHLVLFSEGISYFTEYFYNLLDQEMTHKFLANNTYVKISDKIIYLVELKLESYSLHKEAIRSLARYNLLPQNFCTAQKQLWRSCDQIWYLAGDASTDYNYYTKRALLAAIYSSTLLYWLDDTSEDYQDTKSFLRRKIKNIGSINKWKSSISKFFSELV